MQNLTKSYTMMDATIEITMIFLWAFVLWMMLGWLLKPSYKKPQKVATTKTPEETWPDDFKLIEGIGPAIEKLLQKQGISRYEDIVQADVEWLEEILANAGSRYSIHSPSTWPDQAKLAYEKKWRELEEYQEILNAGKKKK